LKGEPFEENRIELPDYGNAVAFGLDLGLLLPQLVNWSLKPIVIERGKTYVAVVVT
jgi:hypothetical protein